MLSWYLSRAGGETHRTSAKQHKQHDQGAGEQSTLVFIRNANSIFIPQVLLSLAALALGTPEPEAQPSADPYYGYYGLGHYGYAGYPYAYGGYYYGK